MTTENNEYSSITLALSGGRLLAEELAALNQIVQKYKLSIYATTMQNLRLLQVSGNAKDTIICELEDAGLQVKKTGQFPLPKVCAGVPYCKLALKDPQKLSANLLEHMKKHTQVKPKLKMAIAACPANCSGAVLADIGIVATRSGYEVYAGGKGGPLPRTGTRIMRKADEAKVLDVIDALVTFHEKHTTTKKRMFKLMDHPDFPY